ncbi:MAG: DUF2807 domain-containing protein [Muribaculaceae bacterium]
MIKKALFSLLIAICSLGAFAQANSKYEVKVGNFKDLKISDHINVVYNCNPDSSGMARFETTPALADQITFSNNDKGKLTIQLATELTPQMQLPTIYVYSDFLQSVDNTSDSTVRVLSIAPAPNIKLTLSDNGKIIARNLNATTVEARIITGKGIIIVDGKCTTATLKNMGTGEIQADKLVSTNANCQIIGTGSIGCNASNKITIKGTGTGKVYYVGDPKEIKTFQLGSIKAIPLDNNAK